MLGHAERAARAVAEIDSRSESSSIDQTTDREEAERAAARAAQEAKNAQEITNRLAALELTNAPRNTRGASQQTRAAPSSTVFSSIGQQIARGRGPFGSRPPIPTEHLEVQSGLASGMVRMHANASAQSHTEAASQVLQDQDGRSGLASRTRYHH